MHVIFAGAAVVAVDERASPRTRRVALVAADDLRDRAGLHARSPAPGCAERRVAQDARGLVYRRAVVVAARVPRAGSARSADVMLLTVVLLWSGNFTAMRYAIDSFHPLAFSAVRFGLGAALYALVVLWRE